MSNNVMDLLLKSDTTKIKRSTKEIKIRSLSETFDTDVIFTIQSIPVDVYNSIQSGSITVEDDGDLGEIDYNKIQMLTILEGVKEPNLKSKELMEHFNAHTPIELIQIMFAGKPGELSSVYNHINDLCGFGKGAIEEIKN